LKPLLLVASVYLDSIDDLHEKVSRSWENPILPIDLIRILCGYLFETPSLSTVMLPKAPC
jgi:hypothetical protein